MPPSEPPKKKGERSQAAGGEAGAGIPIPEGILNPTLYSLDKAEKFPNIKYQKFPLMKQLQKRSRIIARRSNTEV